MFSVNTSWPVHSGRTVWNSSSSGHVVVRVQVASSAFRNTFGPSGADAYGAVIHEYRHAMRAHSAQWRARTDLAREIDAYLYQLEHSDRVGYSRAEMRGYWHYFNQNFWNNANTRLKDEFQDRFDAIRAQMAALNDDPTALSRCRPPQVARSCGPWELFSGGDGSLNGWTIWTCSGPGQSCVAEVNNPNPLIEDRVNCTDDGAAPEPPTTFG